MTANDRVLVVEDDSTLRIGLKDALLSEGFDVTVAADGRHAQTLLDTRSYHCVVLDVMLPERSGLEVLRTLRARGDLTPILLLTARGDEMDKVLGLDLGADDYVTKPFSLRELVARIRALLRRPSRWTENDVPHCGRFELSRQTIDLEAFTITGEAEVPLTPTEVSMLRTLLAAKGAVVSRERFIQEVWDGVIVGQRTIDTHVLNLRRKVEPDPKTPVHLITAHGSGYRLLGVVER